MRWIAGVLFVVLAGCGEDNAVSSEEANYGAQMWVLLRQQDALVNEFVAVVNTSDTDSSRSAAALEDLSDRFGEHLRGIQAVRPPAAWTLVHDKAIRSAGLFLSAVNLTLSSVADQNPAAMADLNQLVADARRLQREVELDLANLA